MSVKELLNTVKPLYDESGQRYGVFLSNTEWETLTTFIDVSDGVQSSVGRTVLPTMSGQVLSHVDVTNWASVLELVEDDRLKIYNPA